MVSNRNDVLQAVVSAAELVVPNRDRRAGLDGSARLTDVGINSLGIMKLFVELERLLDISMLDLGPLDRELSSLDDVAALIHERFCRA